MTDIIEREAPLTARERFRLAEIAHETKDERLRGLALDLLAIEMSPASIVVRAPAPASVPATAIDRAEVIRLRRDERLSFAKIAARVGCREFDAWKIVKEDRPELREIGLHRGKRSDGSGPA